MISGFATPEGTGRFAQRFAPASQSFKKFRDLTMSSIGMGTYLGDADDRTDAVVTDAVKNSILSGVNVIDTAINYRAQKAERSVGRAVSELVSDGKISRDEIFISTKNGYVTHDADLDLDFWSYVRKEYTQKGLVAEGEISSGYHCMGVKYLEDQLDKSLNNLGLQCVDLMYLHNAVEGQIKDTSHDDLMAKLKLVFEMYEQKRAQGKIRYYGMATWESLRVAQDNPQYLPLDEILSLARQVGGDDHGFCFVQLPFNLQYGEALLLQNHVVSNKPASVLDSAVANNIGVFSSVPFMQGRLLQPGTMPGIEGLAPNLAALQFIRSTPGILAPLVGQKSPEHVRENLQIMNMPPMSETVFLDTVKKLTA